MRKIKSIAVFALILLICAPGVARAGAPFKSYDADAVALAALPLFEWLAACPALEPFKGAPPQNVWAFVVDMYLASAATPGEAPDETHAYDTLFAQGEWTPREGGYVAPEPLSARVSVEAAFDTGMGAVAASIRAEYDYGAGWEFGALFDVRLAPDESAPFGAKIIEVFIPE